MSISRTHIILFVILAVLGHVHRLEAATLTLLWEHSPDPTVAGYVVSYGTQSGVYTTTVRVALVTTASIGNLVEGTTYYFSVQSYNGKGEVGPRSPEVSGVAPKLPGPAPLTISCPAPILTSPDGKPMLVTLSPTVNGGVPPITTTCTPRSRSLFPVGTTPFHCTATDAVPRTASCASTVTILSASSPVPTAPAPTAPAPTAAAAFTNGSFEDDLNGWTVSGNVRAYRAKDSFTASDGDKVATFNAGDQAPTGVISQRFPTTPGASYTLTFDVGAFSVVNRATMRLEATISGTALRTSKAVSVTATGSGSRYVTESLTFVADSTSTTLTLRDVSTGTTDVDLMVDDVRVQTAGATTPTGPAPAAAGLANGSFEEDFAGWTATGNVRAYRAKDSFTASDGEKVATFNAGDQAPTGVVSQRFATTAGKSYTVTFDIGAFSLLNRDTMRLEVTVEGTGLRMTRVVSVAATGTGSRYSTESFSFIADSTATALRFRDVSTTTDNVDLMLDDVRVETATTVPPPTPVPTAAPAFTNGSFESDFAGWSATGNVRALTAQDSLSFSATDGQKVAVFNSGNQAPTGALSQSFATTAGKTYHLTFDVGAFSLVNRGGMRLDVSVEGTALRAKRTVNVSASGSGSRYISETLSFVADGSATKLTFRDMSSTTENVDVLLDNVRLVTR